ncbi:MAG: hypothetical protein Q8K98_09300 [Bacteroidota bacterium]|nr:hypothetical protein [Bacteroidota bacterium]
MNDKPTFPWKKTIIVSASFGAVFAIVSALFLVAYLWFESRPKPPIPWNKSALVAAYDFLDTEGDDNSLVFSYTLENNTDADYNATESQSLTIMANIEDQNILRQSAGKNDPIKLDYPIFVPSKHKVRIKVHFGYSLEHPIKPRGVNEDKKVFRKSLESYLNTEAPSLHGFVIFDHSRRFEISLPKGW